MKIRYHALDTLRGFTLLNMIVYHLLWDLVYLYDLPWSWFYSQGAYIWQQSICWTFILLSGFCWQLGSKSGRRGLTVFLAGILVTVVTVLFVPEEQICFGILTLLGSCMLLLTVLHPYCQKIPAEIGMILSALLFVLMRNVTRGYLGFEGWNLYKMSENLYQNLFSAYLGFPSAEFFSTDYFSLLPWYFLFLAGYYLFSCLRNRSKLQYLQSGIQWLSFLGKHSLPIYLLHQPIIYVVLELFL